MIRLLNILLESEGPAPKKVPSEICWHIGTKKETFPNYGFHIGTELQALDRGLFMLHHEMVDDINNTVFYLHKVKINPSAEIHPEIIYDDPIDSPDLDIDEIDENKIYFYENAHEGVDHPKSVEPNLSIYTGGNNIKLLQTIKLDTKGWQNGESEFDKKFNSL